jgi:hypothetical protein
MPTNETTGRVSGGSDLREQERLGFGRLSRDGRSARTRGSVSSRVNTVTPLSAGLDRDERQEMQAATWNEYLSRSLMTHGRTLDAAATSAADVTWKVAVAAELRDLGVLYRSISHTLHMSKPRIVGSLVFRLGEWPDPVRLVGKQHIRAGVRQLANFREQLKSGTGL